MANSDSLPVIDRPVFLVGSGRSGTTLTYHYLAIHPDLCWFSNASNRAPWLGFMPAVQRVLDIPGLGDGIRRDIVARTGGRFGLRPVEAEIIYARAGFDDRRKMDEADFSETISMKFRAEVARHVKWAGRSRFVSKQTSNNQHVRLLNKIFPDALFIHLVRDGRAVANSILTQGWMDSLHVWWLEDAAINQVHNYRDPIELCALHWKNNVDELLACGEILGNRYIQIRYEDMVSDYSEFMKAVCDFCDLEVVPDHLSLLPKPKKSLDDKWKRELTAKQIDILHDTIGSKLAALGYST
jgi:hypothetical protein